jgi:hypothetical protein
MNKVEIARQPGKINDIGLGNGSGIRLILLPQLELFKVPAPDGDGHGLLQYAVGLES